MLLETVRLLEGSSNWQGLDRKVSFQSTLWALQEVGRDQLSEGTIGSSDPEHGHLLQHMFGSQRYLVTTVPDVAGVEMAGTLKNVVALGAGFVDGLGAGVNAKVTSSSSKINVSSTQGGLCDMKVRSLSSAAQICLMLVVVSAHGMQAEATPVDDKPSMTHCS